MADAPSAEERENRRCSWYALIALLIIGLGLVHAMCHGRDARYDAMSDDEAGLPSKWPAEMK